MSLQDSPVSPPSAQRSAGLWILVLCLAADVGSEDSNSGLYTQVPSVSTHHVISTAPREATFDFGYLWRHDGTLVAGLLLRMHSVGVSSLCHNCFAVVLYRMALR